MDRKILPALAVLLTVSGNGAVADETTVPMTRPDQRLPGTIGFGMMGGLRTIVALVDTNGDGTLSQEEVEAASVRIFKTADTDADGQLTMEEIGTFMDGALQPDSR